jgi:hypothetical protein
MCIHNTPNYRPGLLKCSIQVELLSCSQTDTCKFGCSSCNRSCYTQASTNLLTDVAHDAKYAVTKVGTWPAEVASPDVFWWGEQTH